MFIYVKHENEKAGKKQWRLNCIAEFQKAENPDVNIDKSSEIH